MKRNDRSEKTEREALPVLAERLRRKSRKLTAPRQAILEILRRNFRPLSNKEIFAALPTGECDLATVYRSMQLLQQLGIVKRFDFGDGVGRFEMIEEGEDGHHHHLICTRCSEVVEIEECFPPEFERKIALGSGFVRVTHKLEFFGVCPECQ